MATSFKNASAPARPALEPSRWLLSTVLLAGCVLGALAAFAIAPAVDASVPVDRELVRLLHGMALVKLAFVAAMAGLLVWRFGSPVEAPIAAGYLFSLWSIATATALIWKSAYIGPAALLFHGAGFAFLLLAMRDERLVPESLKRLPRKP